MMRTSFPESCTQTLKLKYKDTIVKVELSLVYISLKQLKNYLNDFLHEDEINYFKTLMYERRQLSYLLGRLAAKQSVANYIGMQSLTEFAINYGVFQYPLVYHPHPDQIQISYSHSGEVCVAAAFPAAIILGIDLETIDVTKDEVIESQLTEEEKNLISSFAERTCMLTMCWTVKEALSKALRTGLTVPFELYAIKLIKQESNYWYSEFKNIVQYKAISFLLGDFVCSIVYPKRFDLEINISAIQNWLNARST